MDRSLQKEREAFKRRALATPTVENKLRKTTDGGAASHSKSSSSSSNSSSNKMKAPDINSYKTLASQSTSQYKFGVLARIVRHMRSRHQEGEVHALTLQEILDETSQLTVGPKIKQWLLTDALPNNPKLTEAEPGSGTWVFNPALNVRDRKGLLKLLRSNDLRGGGGILVEDIQESVPQYLKVLKILAKDIITVTRQTDKKQVVFYHDHSLEFALHPEFQNLWRNTSVDGLHDDNVDEYLNKQGIKSMQGISRVFVPARRKAKSRRNMPTRLADNDHLAHVLEDYDQN